MDVAPLVGHELVHGGEDNAPRRHAQQFAQIGAVFGLPRLLAQELAAAGEGAEELVVEVVAVGEDDERGVLHGGVQDDAPGVEGHGQALAAALRVPDDANALVACAARVVVAFRAVEARPLANTSALAWGGRARSVCSTAALTAWNW